MTFKRDEDRRSILGALKPGRDQTVSRAILTTYSLDLVAMLGLVLSLGGDPEAEFENSPLGLVKAFERMRGKLIVVHQLGRVVAPSKHRSVLPLLDTMVVAVPANERRGSWHPKVALVRYAGAASTEWRFWIGSRNLTGSTDLDAGVLLISTKDRAAKPVPGIAALAADLLQEAQLSASELDELKSARWITPAGVSVRDVLWRRHGQTKAFIAGPMIAGADRGCAVSPFINRGGLDEALKAGAANLALLTTEMAAINCAPHHHVKFRVDTAPEPEATVSIEQQQEAVEGEFVDPPSTGIHAKLLAISKGQRTALMLGSANLTKRGLVGPNAEAVVLLDVTDEALVESLYDFVGAGLELATEERDAALAEQEQAKRELDALISQFLEIPLSLRSDHDGLHLQLGTGGNEVLKLASFYAAAFLEEEAWIPIENGTTSVRLLPDPPVLSEQTALVRFRARSLGEPQVSRTWVQAVDVEGLDTERRDRALLARYVGANRFRDWLRSLLDGIDGTGGQKWSADWKGERPQEAAGEFARIFALETMLASWARDPKAFEARVAGMMSMLDAFEEVFATIAEDSEREAALNDLNEVRPFLQAVHDAIDEPA